jgi:hypothetical protein
MTGYDLMQFIAENQLGEAEVVVEGMINAVYPASEEEDKDGRQISVSAERVEGTYRGRAVEIRFGDVEIDLR